METDRVRRRKKKKKSGNLMPVLVTAGVILILVIALVISFVWKKYSLGTERAVLSNVYTVSGDQVNVFVDMEELPSHGVVRDGVFYLDLDTVRENLDSRYYLDSDNTIRYCLPQEIVKVPAGSASFGMQGQTVNLGHSAVLRENGVTYLALDFITKLTPVAQETYTEPNRLYFFTDFETPMQMAKAKQDTQVRLQAGIKSLILVDVPKDASLWVIRELDEDWSEVFYEGCRGYLQTKRITQDGTTLRAQPFEPWQYTGISLDGTVRLVWHQVFSVEDNNNLASLLDGSEGVNVISPTWFALSGADGSFTSLAMSSYVNKAHEMGMQVWILVNDFSDVSLYDTLSVNASRENFIKKLIRATTEVKADGINIDFEYVYQDTGVHFVEFIRELALACHENGLVLSVDNFVPVGGRSWVERREQSVFADYVIIMSYDEHYSGSRAGSTSSYGFSKAGIEDTLAEGIPAEKLINGIPFYTRAWTEVPESAAAAGSQIIQDPNSIYGRYALSSYSLSMVKAASLLTEHNASLTWLTEERQNYGQYQENGGTVRIWLEDTRSLQEKLNLVKEHQIAGAAFWKLGLEDKAVWPLIRDTLP